MFGGTAAIGWGSMLTDMLNAPISKLAVSNNVDAGKNFLNARALAVVSRQTND
jgi:hypothetical protein